MRLKIILNELENRVNLHINDLSSGGQAVITGVDVLEPPDTALPAIAAAANAVLLFFGIRILPPPFIFSNNYNRLKTS